MVTFEQIQAAYYARAEVMSIPDYYMNFEYLAGEMDKHQWITGRAIVYSTGGTLSSGLEVMADTLLA